MIVERIGDFLQFVCCDVSSVGLPLSGSSLSLAEFDMKCNVFRGFGNGNIRVFLKNAS